MKGGVFEGVGSSGGSGDAELLVGLGVCLSCLHLPYRLQIGSPLRLSLGLAACWGVLVGGVKMPLGIIAGAAHRSPEPVTSSCW